MPLSILLAVADGRDTREHLAAQLAADGHDAYQARTREHAASLLAGRHLDALVLGALERPAAALALLRDLRAGRLGGRVPDDVPVITLGPLACADELDALRAYEAGSDHHLPAGAGYLHLRAVIAAVHRRAHAGAGRVRRIGAIELDTNAREVRVAGKPVALSAKEFALLTALARDPRRVFTKHELLRDVWDYHAPGRTRTLDSHACRLRRKLSDHGAHAVIAVWGVGYRLTDTEPPSA